MSVLRVFVVVWFLVFFTSEFGFADPTYGKVGDSVVLDPGQTSGPISSVTWKHRTDLALEWFGGEITCYRTFKGRCELDKTTGSFTIRNLTPEDSGEYTPEINNRVLGKKELKFIKPVPKPTVSMACNKEKTVCNLTCEANITSEFGPVTYEWKTGDTELSTNKELSLTTKNEESSFSCSLKNPVSNSTSDEFPNPIITGNSDTTVIVLVALLLGFVVVAVIGAVFMNRAGYLPLLDKIFPCNEKARSEKRRAALMKGDAAEAASDTRQDDAAHVMMSLLSTKNETDQDQAAETPNGGLHKGNETLDDEAAGKPDDSTCAPSVDTQPEQEIISKGKEALNGHLIDNMNRDEEPNDPTCNPSVDQESNPDPSVVTPEPNSQTDSMEQQQDPPAQQVGDDQGESGQNSRPEEPESTTEEPENNSNGEETLSGDQHANKNEDDSMEQQQQVPPAQQVGDDQGASGQNSRPEEPESNATGSETSPPESRSEETPDTDLAES